MSDNKSLVKYGEWTPEAASEQVSEVSAAAAGDFMKLAVGRTVVRFLPPLPGQRSPFVQVFQHFISMPDGERPLTFACPAKHQRRSCPVCAEATRLSRTGNRADKDRAFELFPKLRVFANVIDRANPDMGPRILPFGKQIFDALTSIRLDEDAGGNFTDPTDAGFDIVIERVGTGKNDTEYKARAARQNSPLGDMSVIEEQHDLSAYATPPTDEELEEMLENASVLVDPQRARRAAGQRALPPASNPGRGAPAPGRGAPAQGRSPRRTADAALDGDDDDNAPF